MAKLSRQIWLAIPQSHLSRWRESSLSWPYFAIGFILYFQVREPLPFSCPRCSTMVGARFNFCPNCKCNLHPSCPNCKREVAETDKFCPYCAQDLVSKGEIGESLAEEHS